MSASSPLSRYHKNLATIPPLDKETAPSQLRETKVDFSGVPEADEVICVRGTGGEYWFAAVRSVVFDGKDQPRFVWLVSVRTRRIWNGTLWPFPVPGSHQSPVNDAPRLHLSWLRPKSKHAASDIARCAPRCVASHGKGALNKQHMDGTKCRLTKSLFGFDGIEPTPQPLDCVLFRLRFQVGVKPRNKTLEREKAVAAYMQKKAEAGQNPGASTPGDKLERDVEHRV